MTLTRSQTGNTPRKSKLPEGFVETPHRRVSRKAVAAQETATPASSESTRSAASGANGSAKSNGATKSNGSVKANGSSKGKPIAVDNPKIDTSGHFEFGGTPGVSAMMIGFPLLMWYMWIGATYYDGKFPTPSKGQSFPEFFKHLFDLAWIGAFPHAKAWAIYWTFFLFEGACYMLMPGVYMKGKPLEHLGGKQLDYYCSAYSSFYLTILLAGTLHVTGLFKLYTIIDEFGPIMSVAIISGFLVSIVAYVSALVRGAEHRMTGRPIYDFFMGAELNPRMFGLLDFKMFFEVRLPWFILFLLSLGAAARQWEQYGYVSGEVCFILMAHFLYANACGKGEELITTTWDMYYEKWGFMLIFWNLAGVPLSYCHCTIYLANHDPAEYRWPRWFLAFLFASYLFAYWVWDTCGSQKNLFRAHQRGGAPVRNTFPQLPFRHIENPRVVPVPGHDPLLADGWYRYARKIHYTCDMWFSFCWGLITGFKSPFPWFYPVFFALMIAHRAYRDIQRCRERYGEAWIQYEKMVPYLFVPGVF